MGARQTANHDSPASAARTPVCEIVAEEVNDAHANTPSATTAVTEATHGAESRARATLTLSRARISQTGAAVANSSNTTTCEGRLILAASISSSTTAAEAAPETSAASRRPCSGRKARIIPNAVTVHTAMSTATRSRSGPMLNGTVNTWSWPNAQATGRAHEHCMASRSSLLGRRWYTTAITIGMNTMAL